MSRTCYLCLSASKGSKRQKRTPIISYHKFPSNSKTRKAWFIACGLSEVVDDVSKIRICSIHFTINDYVEPNARSFGGTMWLRKEAVPSILVPYPLSPADIDNIKNEKTESTMEILPFLSSPAVTDIKKEMCKVSSSTSIVDVGEIIKCNITKVQTELCNSADQQSNNYDSVFSPFSNTSVTDADGTAANQQNVKNGKISPQKQKLAQQQYLSEIRTTDMMTPSEARMVLPTSVAEVNGITLPDIIKQTPELCNAVNEQNLESGKTSPKKRKFAQPRFISEIRTTDMMTPRGARMVLSMVKRNDSKKSKKIKYLQRSNKKLLKHISSIKDLVKCLNDSELLTEEAADFLLARIMKCS